MTSEDNSTILDYAHRTMRPRPWVLTSSGLAFVGAVVILGLMAVSDRFGFPRTSCGRESYARAQLGPNGPLASALELYKFYTGRYPGRLRELFVAPQSQVAPTTWRGPYLRDPDDIKDPWGHEIRYVRTQRAGPSGPIEQFNVWSIGPDGVGQTADDIRSP